MKCTNGCQAYRMLFNKLLFGHFKQQHPSAFNSNMPPSRTGTQDAQENSADGRRPRYASRARFATVYLRG